MRLGHMFRQCAVAAVTVVAQVAGHSLLLMEYFDGSGTDQQVYPLMGQAVRERVTMALILHVIVDVDPGRPPDGKDVNLRWQGLQGRPVQGFEGVFTAAGQLFEGALIQVLQQAANLPVEIHQREDLEVAQSHQNPSLHHLYANRDLRLVFGFIGTRREDYGPVMSGQILMLRLICGS